MNKDTHRKVFLNIIDYYNVDNNKGTPIDALIAKTILILNKKGYKTKFCCSGHTCIDETSEEHVCFDVQDRDQVIQKLNSDIQRYGTHPYISFEKTYEKLPYLRGWLMDNSGVVQDCGTYIYCVVKKPTYRKLKKVHARLKNWAKKLPPIRGNN